MTKKLMQGALLLTVVLSPTSVFAQECDNKDNVGSPINGYCDSWGNYTPGYITNQWYMTSTPQYTSGKMVFYHPGSMRATAEYRGIEYDDCIGGVSLMSPIDIGRKAWIRVNDEWHGPFCVVDCARKGDMYSIVAIREEVVEVDFDFAEQLGMVELLNEYTNEYKVNNWYLDVEVWLPRRDYQSETPSGGEIVHYPTWWLENVEFATKYETRVIQNQYGVWKEYGRNKYWHVKLSNYPLRSVASESLIR